MRVRLPSHRRLLPRAAVLPLVALAVFTTFACSIDKLTMPKGNKPTLSATVTGDTTVAMGGTLPLRVATVGGLLDSTVALRWSTDRPAVATVDSLTGIVTGIGLGTATISAQVIAPGFPEVAATSLTIRVKYAGIKITAVDSLIAIGMTKVIVVHGVNPAGTALAAIPFSTAMTVVSRDPTLFTVNTAGALVAVKNGSARVFVQFDGLADSASVKVRQVTRAMTFPGANTSGELPIGSLNKDRTVAIAATDSLGVAIAAPIVTWGTSDASTVSVITSTGVAHGVKNGTATLTATSDGLAKTIVARVIQIPSGLTKTAATDAQSAIVNTAVALPPEVTVVDSGAAPVSGVAVTYVVASGGGSVSGGTPTSAVTGKAAVTSWTLGTTAGANTLLASAGGLNALFTATGTFGPAKKLGFKVQPVNTAAGQTMPGIQVAVLDSLDNVVTSANNSITIAIGSGTGALSGTLTAAATAGIATFSTASIGTAGTFTLLASATNLVSGTSNSFGIFGAATKLAFLTTSISGTVGQPIGSIRVAVEDALGNVVTSDTRTITVSITPATGPGGTAALTGTLGVAAVGGIATFSTLSLTAAGTAATSNAYKLNAAAAPLTTATSSAFDIVAVGPAAKLAFTVQPATVVSGATIAPSIQVAIQDAAGAQTSSTASVTLAIEINPGNGTLSGTLTQPAVAGVATFAGMSIDKVGTAYKLNATSGTLTKAVSSAFNVAAGSPARVAFLVPPTNAVAGAVMAPAVQVAIQDNNGNTVTASTASVSLAVGSGPQGAALGGLTTVPAVAGIASFSNLTLSPASNAYTLTANSSGLTSVPSASFLITANATTAIKLGFVTQPSNVSGGTAIAPPIQVAVQDANGATVSSSSVQVALALGTNANGAVASGTLTTFASGGIATFSNAQVALAGTGYTMVASAAAASLTPITSTPFNVTSGSANKLAFIVQPTAIVAGNAFAQDIQVAIEDAGGNVVTTATNVVTLAVTNFGTVAIHGPTAVAAINGIATFTGAREIKSGSGVTLFATASSLGGATSVSFDVAPAPPVGLTFKQTPQNVSAGSLQTLPIQVQVSDSLGNLIAGATDQITLALIQAPTNGVISSGTVSVAASAGVASFADIKFNVAGTYALAATAPNLASVPGAFFTVTPGMPASLKWVDNPLASIRGATLQSSNGRLRVDILDALNNIVTTGTGANASVTITASLGTLTGTLPQAAVNGSAFFNDLVDGGAAATGSITLTAASAGLTPAISTAFTQAAFGAAFKAVFTVQPTNIDPSNPISPAPQVSIEDQFNNIVTNSTTTVGISVNSGPGSVTGTTSVAASAGVATFSNLLFTTAGDYKIATSGLPTADISNSFLIAQNVGISAGNNLWDVNINGTTSLVFADHSASSMIQKNNPSSLTPFLVLNGVPFVGGVVTDGANVYWIEDANNATTGTVGQIRKCSLASLPCTAPTVVTSGLTSVASTLQTDGAGNLYFIAGNVGNTQRSIMKIAMSAVSGTPTTLFTAGCGLTCTPTFTINGATIYFSNGVNTISSMTTTGASQSVVETAVNTALSIAATSTTVYWIDGGGAIVFAAALDHSSLLAPIQGETGLTHIVIDGTSTNMYALTGNSVKRYTLSGFTATTMTSLAAGTASRALAVDGSFVYFADNTTVSGTAAPRLRRIPK